MKGRVNKNLVRLGWLEQGQVELYWSQVGLGCHKSGQVRFNWAGRVWGLYYKILSTDNLRKMDRVRINLVYLSKLVKPTDNNTDTSFVYKCPFSVHYECFIREHLLKGKAQYS
jgi:hypothetical protein